MHLCERLELEQNGLLILAARSASRKKNWVTSLVLLRFSGKHTGEVIY